MSLAPTLTVDTDVLARAVRWSRDQAVAVATVVGATGSAPRPSGAAMAVSAAGEVAGSVSGGCVEAAVYDLALQAITSGTAGLHRFGVTGDDPDDGPGLGVGLTCGGEIEVFVARLEPEQAAGVATALELADRGLPVALATVIEHPVPELVGTRLLVGTDRHQLLPGAGRAAIAPRLEREIAAGARAQLADGTDGCLTFGADGTRLGHEVRALVQTWAPPPRLIVFGAVDFAVALARLGRFLGAHVTVCDARPVFAHPERFADAHDVVVDWPDRYLRVEAEAGRLDRRTAVCVLTHDPKFDVPVLREALALDLGYVGAMGSRRTHHDRLDRLRAAGVTEQQLGRLRSPIGLDLGARTPEETALSILAEVVADRWGGSGRRLGDTGGAVHHPRHESCHSRSTV